VKLIISLAATQAMSPKHMPRRDAIALLDKLGEFAADPFAGHLCAMPLSGHSNRLRIRQGDWRAIVLVVRSEHAVIVERRIQHRREVYR